jgi:hypothetical protein
MQKETLYFPRTSDSLFSAFKCPPSTRNWSAKRRVQKNQVRAPQRGTCRGWKWTDRWLQRRNRTPHHAYRSFHDSGRLASRIESFVSSAARSHPSPTLGAKSAAQAYPAATKPPALPRRQSTFLPFSGLETCKQILHVNLSSWHRIAEKWWTLSSPGHRRAHSLRTPPDAPVAWLNLLSTKASARLVPGCWYGAERHNTDGWLETYPADCQKGG